ncbi:hypothetical protein GPECTOR_99g799 [Gonium pectorale]|uniref:DUF7605 domain-containing protein n=1 Tax=Gonium pectorale TaxID=33097 RepID=A0A150FZZ4_GONPE|nr:hypothetical protein GPECTOR_99g799 [Gonium pectorale]|eukprot:KXZ43164.1 hypothetical protein GPECTOR_99g799 [Gonium pectorale]
MCNAAVTRGGTYVSPTLRLRKSSIFPEGRINLNAQLAEPILEAVSVTWDDLFNRRLEALMRDAQQRALASFDAAVAAARERLAAQLGAEAAADQLAAVEAAHKRMRADESRKLESVVTEALKAATQAARAPHVDVVETAMRAVMQPAYDAARADRGLGKFGRMKAAVEAHVEEVMPDALVGVAAEVASILLDVEGRLRAGLEGHQGGAAARYGLLWDRSSATASARSAAATALRAQAAQAAQLCRRVGTAPVRPFALNLRAPQQAPPGPDVPGASVSAAAGAANSSGKDVADDLAAVAAAAFTVAIAAAAVTAAAAVATATVTDVVAAIVATAAADIASSVCATSAAAAAPPASVMAANAAA